MRQNIAIMTLFLGVAHTEEVQQNNNATIQQISSKIDEISEESRKNLLALEQEIQEDPVDEEAEADADATDENQIPEPPLPKGSKPKDSTSATEEEEKPSEGPSTPANINDEDAKCYSSRYQDIDALLDPKSHYATVGIQQGRLGTCAKRLTDIEAQRYLSSNPELQRAYGKTGPSSLQQAREHWQNVGYKNNVLAASVSDKDNLPFKCASGATESCMCPGTLWFGPAVRPDNGAKIETFEEMREWRTLSADSDDWQSCSMIEFGSDPMPGTDKQCFCEVKPAYESARCADEGDDCLCNGHVYFAPRFKSDHSTPARFFDILAEQFTLVDANSTGSVSCTSDSFEGADPQPDYPKQCFCDDKKTFTTHQEMQNIQDYFRSEVTVSSTESEIKTVMAQQQLAESEDYEYGEYYGMDDYYDTDYGANSCAMCEETCSSDSDRYLRDELDRRRTLTRRKYSRMRDVNKYRRVTARNKRIAGDNACTAAQKARDPAEKAKQRKLCYELRTESSRLITETDIELQNIEEQQKTEERIINEETTKITNDKTEKTIINEKTTQINKSKLKEETSSRITKETEERITLINKKVETEKITESIITTETTNIEKQVTNINKQIEDIENELTKEIKKEREEEENVGGENPDNQSPIDEELTNEVKNKKEDLTSKEEKITSKIEKLTSKVTELETIIETVTKKITNIKIQIENVTSTISEQSKLKEILNHHVKEVTGSEKTVIQEQIDKITSDITNYKSELESLTSEREELITQETTSRTELTFVSQDLKKSEVYKQHLEEQIVVTSVVIESKEKKSEEEKTKKEITSIQHNCFMKKLYLDMMKEQFKQFKANLNKKISKKKKILEDARLQLTTTMEDLSNSKSNLATLELQLSKTTEAGQKVIIETRITLVKSEISKYTTSIETYNSTVTTLTTELTDLVSGKTTTSKQEEIDKLTEEVNKIMMESVMKLMMLPMLSSSSSSSNTNIMTTATKHCGVITGVSIKGDIGGTITSTSTSTTTSDVSTQIIEKEDYAEKMREEFTKISEIAKIQKEEINESITNSKKVLEEIQKMISEQKIHLQEMRSKEKEINTKITSSTESSEIETYKHELTSITNQITTIKKVIKEETQKKVQTESKITEEINKIKEIDNRVETSENDSNTATNEALHYITEGIEATYIIHKKDIHDSHVTDLKKKEEEYKEKKVKYEEEKTSITKIINEKITKVTSYESEVSDIKKRIEEDEKRIEKTTSEEDKKVITEEVNTLKSEMEKYAKMIELMKLEITSAKGNQTVINQNFNNVYNNYTTTRAETYNSEEEYKEYERLISDRRRHYHHHSVHNSTLISHKKKAETHRHATEETKKKVTKQTKHFKSQRYNMRCERSRHEHNSKTYTKEVTIEEKKIIELRKKIEITKDESEKIKIQDEITSLEASIETYKNNIKTEISKMHKVEEEETNISNKITSMEETVKKLEEETIKIEEESKTIEKSTTSDTAKKVVEEVHKRKKVTEDIIKHNLKEKIDRLTKLVEEKEKKIEDNTVKIVDQTKLISQSTSNLGRFTRINERQTFVNRVAVCQRMLIEEPSYFDVNVICQTSMFSNINAMNNGQNNGFGGVAGGGRITAASQQCQACYTLNPTCSGGSSTSGISVIAFSVDTQGEADDLVNQLFNENMIADVNFLSSMVNRKFALYGQVSNDPSQVRVELVTSDARSNQVVSKVGQWRTAQGKPLTGNQNDAQITPLTGGSQDYITFVQRQTAQSFSVASSNPPMRFAASPMMRAAPQPMMTMGGYGGFMAQNGSSDMEEDKPAENNKVETMNSFISEFY